MVADRKKSRGTKTKAKVVAATAAARAPAPSRLAYPDDYRREMSEEFAISQEIVAAGFNLVPRIRIVGAEEWSVTLPVDQYDTGRVLLALRSFAALAMAKGIIVSTPEPGGFDVWLLTAGGVLGYSVICAHDPMYRVVDTREHRDALHNAPALPLSLASLLLPGSGRLTQPEMDLVQEMLGPQGLYPATQLNPAPNQHPPGVVQTWTH